MNWDRLEAFLAVVDTRGFSAAARALGKTQSAVSQAIGRLEEDLGEQLLVRGRGAVTLTDAGRILAQHGRLATRELQAARERLAALALLQAGRLLLGTTDTLGCHLLPPALATFRDRYPAVEVQLQAAPSPATAMRVARRELDVGVVSLPLPDGLRIAGRPLPEAIAIERLGPQPDVVVVHAEHTLANHKVITWNQLDGVDLLLPGADTGSRALLDEIFEDHGIRPRIAMEMNSVELLMRLAELGFGAAIVPAMAAAGARRSHLKAVPLAGVGPPRTEAPHAGQDRAVGLVLPISQPVARTALAFAEVLRAML